MSGASFPVSSSVSKPSTEVKAGDWACGKCNANNFASRNECYSCKAAKPASVQNTSKATSATAAVGDRAGRRSFPVTATVSAPSTEVKLGDWACSECSANNFASRSECYGCKAAKPSSAQAQQERKSTKQHNVASPNESGRRSFPVGGTVSAPSTQVLAGDWACGECSANNFASRNECYSCKAAKPSQQASSSPAASTNTKPSKLAPAAVGGDREDNRYSTSMIVNGRCTVCRVGVPDAQKEMHLAGKKHAHQVFHNPMKRTGNAGGSDNNNANYGNINNNEKEGEVVIEGYNAPTKFSAFVPCPAGVAGHVIGLKGATLIALQEKVGHNCAINRNTKAGPNRKNEKDGACKFFIEASRQSAADQGAQLLAAKIQETVAQIASGRIKVPKTTAQWVCSGCNAKNFASRNECYSCKAARTTGGRADQPEDSSDSDDEDEDDKKPSAPGVEVVERAFPVTSAVAKPSTQVMSGDWACGKCNANNFASRNECYSCKAAKSSPAQKSESDDGDDDEQEQDDATPTDDKKERAFPTTSAVSKPSTQVMDGDWPCPECSANNFASRNECYGCKAARPGGAPQKEEQPRKADKKMKKSSGDETSKQTSKNEIKEGDWRCAKCSMNNFSSRSSCFGCKSAKPPSHKAVERAEIRKEAQDAWKKQNPNRAERRKEAQQAWMQKSGGGLDTLEEDESDKQDPDLAGESEVKPAAAVALEDAEEKPKKVGDEKVEVNAAKRHQLRRQERRKEVREKGGVVTAQGGGGGGEEDDVPPPASTAPKPSTSAPTPKPDADVGRKSFPTTSAISKPSTEVKAGDWACSKCNANNFASRNECYSCKAAKPSPTAAAAAGSSTKKKALATTKPAKPTAAPSVVVAADAGRRSFPTTSAISAPSTEVKAGDWACSGCSANNFASRFECYSCKAPKQEQQQQAPTSHSRLSGMKRDRDTAVASDVPVAGGGTIAGAALSAEADKLRQEEERQAERVARKRRLEESNSIIVDGICKVCKCKVEPKNLAHISGKKHLKNMREAGL